ncbi:MAG: LysR family transcriptional regulator [Collinsella sp.]|nr:LysR family transcriptional regulator [Collinsella sp.]
MTPNAIIKQMNLLEARPGVRLFDRNHSGLALTEAGRALYEEASWVLWACNNAVERVKRAAANHRSISREVFPHDPK